GPRLLRPPPRRPRASLFPTSVLGDLPPRRAAAPAPPPVRARIRARAHAGRRPVRPGIRGGAGWPVVPLGPAGRRLDRDRHHSAHLRPLAAPRAAPSRDRRPAA